MWHWDIPKFQTGISFSHPAGSQKLSLRSSGSTWTAKLMGFQEDVFPFRKADVQTSMLVFVCFVDVYRHVTCLLKLILPWCLKLSLFSSCHVFIEASKKLGVVGHLCGTTSPTKMCSQTSASKACHFRRLSYDLFYFENFLSKGRDVKGSEYSDSSLNFKKQICWHECYINMWSLLWTLQLKMPCYTSLKNCQFPG